MNFRWLGVAGFELELNGSTLLVDPFLTRPPVYRLFWGRVRPDLPLLRRYIPQADHILVSHSHYDHLMDVTAIAGYTGAMVYGSAHTCRIVEACGLPAAQIRRVRPGENFDLTGKGGEKTFSIDILSGAHTPLPLYGPGQLPERLQPPLRLRDFVLDETFTFLISSSGTRVLAWHNHRPCPAPRADVLLLIPDVLPADLPALLDQVQPRLIIPIHWENFFRPSDAPLHRSWRIPTWRRPWLERADPWALQRWVVRCRSGVEVYVPRLWEQIELSEGHGFQSGA